MFFTLLSGTFVQGRDGAGERPVVLSSPSSGELTPSREGRCVTLATREPRSAGPLHPAKV